MNKHIRDFLFLVFGVLFIAVLTFSLDTEELDEYEDSLCNKEGMIFYRNATTWGCINITDADINVTITNITIMINGTDGRNGTDGINGTNGIDGTNGTDGAQGPQGIQGLPGIDGINGTNGNTSWNQSLADTLYMDINAVTGNQTFNQTLTDSLYAKHTNVINNATKTLQDAYSNDTYEHPAIYTAMTNNASLKANLAGGNTFTGIQQFMSDVYFFNGTYLTGIQSNKANASLCITDLAGICKINLSGITGNINMTGELITSNITIRSGASNSKVTTWKANDLSDMATMEETGGGAGYFTIRDANGVNRVVLRGDGGNNVFDSASNLSLGMPTAPFKLTVNGSINATVNITGSAYCIGASCITSWNNINGTGNTTAQMRAAVNGQVNATSWNKTGTNVILATTTDKVGIGVTTPTHTLNVKGEANISSYIGVYGETPTATYGISARPYINPGGPTGAIIGYTNVTQTTYGVLGATTVNSAYNYGVYGVAPTTGTTSYAGYFSGNAYVSGNLGVGTATPDYKLSVTGTGINISNSSQTAKFCLNGVCSTAIGAGTVTSVATGEGLTGGTITSTGTLRIAPNTSERINWSQARSQAVLTGGGIIAWNTTSQNLSWTSRFIWLPVDRNVNSQGYVQLNAASWQLVDWTAIYANCTQASVTCNVEVRTYNDATEDMDTWLLLAMRNADTGLIQFADGTTMDDTITTTITNLGEYNQGGSPTLKNLKIAPANANGILFWQSTSYSIYMTNADPDFGGVTDYSLSNRMTDTNGRGFLWRNENEVGMSLESYTGEWDLTVRNDITALNGTISIGTATNAQGIGSMNMTGNMTVQNIIKSNTGNVIVMIGN